MKSKKCRIKINENLNTEKNQKDSLRKISGGWRETVREKELATFLFLTGRIISFKCT